MRPAPNRFPIVRIPPLRSVVVLVLAVVVGLSVHRTTAEARAAAARFSSTTDVFVVQRTVDAGTEIGATDVRVEPRPTAHVPDGAARRAVVGRTTRATLRPGEVVIDDRLAGGERSGAAALVPERWAAVAISFVDAPLPVTAGAVVDIVASFDPTLVEQDPSRVVVADAIVIDVGADAATVAVPRTRTADVAFALTNGVVTLALVG